MRGQPISHEQEQETGSDTLFRAVFTHAVPPCNLRRVDGETGPRTYAKMQQL